MFQLGLILYELSCKIGTHMERNLLFYKLRRGDFGDCPLLSDHVEYRMIKLMTADDPAQRPDLSQIAEYWLPLWDK